MDDYESAAGVVTTDAGLLVRSWNEWLSAATGIPAAEAIGRSLYDLVPDLEERGLAARLRQAIDDGMAQVLAPALHHYLIPALPRQPSAHFEHMQQRVTIVPLHVERSGQAAGALILIEDVTSRLEAEHELAIQLQSSDEAVRLQAVQALSGTGELQPHLVAALGDPSWRVRRAAGGSLVRYHEPAVVAAILQALRDGHHDLRVVAGTLHVLALTDVDVVPPLIEFLRGPDPDLRIYAALLLGDRNDAHAVPALLRALSDPDANVRYHAVEALGKLRALQAVEPLLDIVAARDFFLAFPAMEALKLIGDPRAVPGLIDLLDDELLRVPAAEALGRLGGEQVIRPLMALLGGGRGPADAGEVLAAARGLAALYDRYELAYGEGEYIAGLAREAAGDGTQ